MSTLLQAAAAPDRQGDRSAGGGGQEMVQQGGVSEEPGGLVQNGSHGGVCGQGALQAAHTGQEECPNLYVEIIWQQSLTMNG